MENAVQSYRSGLDAPNPLLEQVPMTRGACIEPIKP